MRYANTGYPSMHRAITILCMHAGALTYACDNIAQFWATHTFWREDWAYYMQPGSDGGGAHSDAWHLMQDDGQGKQEDGGSCKYPAYIMCPAFDRNMLITKEICQPNTPCETLRAVS